jgi:hypothetical protein
MSVGPHISARRAALTVHALDPEDRAWMLAQLQPQQRAAIEPLLEELRDLGIRPERRALEQIQDETASLATAGGRLTRLDRKEIRQLARVLEQEAPEVARALLTAGEPTWRGTLMKEFAPGFAVRVNRLSPVPVAGPALRDALAVAVERKLAQRQASARAGRPWWQAWGFRRRST